MANYFIKGEGTLEPAAGSFVVPVGTTIYFFSPPNSVLESRYVDFFMGQLCASLISPTAEAYVRALSIEVAPEGETVPNHLAVGARLDDREPTGVYLVGRPSTDGPVIRLLDGVRRSLKDLVSGITEGGSIGSHIYWGVSRRNRRIRVGAMPRQYFDGATNRPPRTARNGRRPKLRGLWDDLSPLGSTGFVLERLVDRVDDIDFPQFREFKARLRGGGEPLG